MISVSATIAHLQSSLQPLEPYYRQAETYFLTVTGTINFTLFCIIYTVVLVVLLRRLTKEKAWRPRNKELKRNCLVIQHSSSSSNRR